MCFLKPLSGSSCYDHPLSVGLQQNLEANLKTFLTPERENVSIHLHYYCFIKSHTIQTTTDNLNLFLSPACRNME